MKRSKAPRSMETTGAGGMKGTGKLLSLVVEIDTKRKELVVHKIGAGKPKATNILIWEDDLDRSPKDLRSPVPQATEELMEDIEEVDDCQYLKANQVNDCFIPNLFPITYSLIIFSLYDKEGVTYLALSNIVFRPFEVEKELGLIFTKHRPFLML